MNGTREAVLFAMALERLADQRSAFLDSVCANAPALLAAHEDPDSRL